MTNEIRKNTALVIGSALQGRKDYFLDNSAFDYSGLIKDCPKLLRPIRRFCLSHSSMPKKIWLTRPALSLANYQTIVIFASYLSNPLARFFQKQNPKARLIYWYWNPVDQDTLPQKLPKEIEIWSFNPEDVAKYGMHFNNQFYAPLPLQRPLTTKKSVFFVGYDKGRAEVINRISSKLEDEGIAADFHILKEGQKAIDYELTVAQLLQGQGVLEITQSHQNGLTLRPLEALFYEKKLLTTNSRIREEPFYRENNIYIFDDKEQRKLSDFFALPYDHSADAYKATYSVCGWFSHFQQS